MTRWLKRWSLVAVNDAYRLMPFADALYACDRKWWLKHKPQFSGEMWTSHEPHSLNDKSDLQIDGLNYVAGTHGIGFSLNPSVLHYGSNSGFQAINLAILKGCRFIVLVGFDMCRRDKAHFFGDHPEGFYTNSDRDFRAYIPEFEMAAKRMPADLTIINATPGSALSCFPMMSLKDAVDRGESERYGGVHRHRPEFDGRADTGRENQGVCAGGVQ